MHLESLTHFCSAGEKSLDFFAYDHSSSWLIDVRSKTTTISPVLCKTVISSSSFIPSWNGQRQNNLHKRSQVLKCKISFIGTSLWSLKISMDVYKLNQNEHINIIVSDSAGRNRALFWFKVLTNWNNMEWHFFKVIFELTSIFIVIIC